MTARYVPPRVALVDPKTGLVTTQWYLFFQGLMDPAMMNAEARAEFAYLASLTGQGGVPDVAADALDALPVAADPAIVDSLEGAPALPWHEPLDADVPPLPCDITADELEAMVAEGRFTLPTYPDDAAAGAGGLTAGALYKTAAGELRIKL